MSAIDEGIVREYFEQNGFLVRQLRKYDVQARKKTGEEEIDLLVYNPSYQRGARKPDFFLFSNELAYIHRAIVVIRLMPEFFTFRGVRQERWPRLMRRRVCNTTRRKLRRWCHGLMWLPSPA